MIRILLSGLFFIASVLLLVCTGATVDAVLRLYSPGHLQSFGPVVPAFSQSVAQWMGSAPVALYAMAAVSTAAGLYVWRSRHAVERKTFAVMAIAATNLYVAAFCLMSLLVAYFYLPGHANDTLRTAQTKKAGRMETSGPGDAVRNYSVGVAAAVVAGGESSRRT